MKIVCDFHIHSRFARATSKELTILNLDIWAKKKGISIMGTGDCTHPVWFKELRGELESAEQGLYKRKNGGDTRFVLSAEISCIYSKGGKVRRVHLILLIPSFEAAEKINAQLSQRGNIRSDGRPILGIDAKEIVKIALDADPICMIIPAHAWTPWFSVFGSKSGFNSLEECFDEYTKYIYAIETGLSSDPAMNRRLSALDNIALLSNSDSHSLEKIGREVNVFNTGMSYGEIIDSIKTKDLKKFLYTIEFFPEEGKYHHDGHRLCNISLSPEESQKQKNICPVCKKPLTIGVLNRVVELADRPEGSWPKGVVPFKRLIPLQEIVAEAQDSGVGTKRGKKEYENLIKVFGNEFFVLLDAPEQELKNATTHEIAEGIIRVREGKVIIIPGYDGEYGKIQIFSKEDRKRTFV